MNKTLPNVQTAIDKPLMALRRTATIPLRVILLIPQVPFLKWQILVVMPC